MNPMQMFVSQMMNNSQVMKNPMLKNAINMANKGDSKGIEQMARNLCAEKGINPEEAITQIKSQFGIRI